MDSHMDAQRLLTLSEAIAKICRLSEGRFDLFLLLVALIEGGEIDVIEAMQILRLLREQGETFYVMDAEGIPRLQWATPRQSVN
jgi:hypothetical protein